MGNNAVNEAKIEGRNDDALVGLAVVKRRGKAEAEEQFVVSTLGDFVKLLKTLGIQS